METIGIVGIGLVGTALAEHLLARGYRVVGYDIDPQRNHHLESLGGCPAGSAREVAEGAGRVLLSLMDSDVVCRVVEGQDGLLASTRPPTHIVDPTTGDPVETEALAGRLAARGVAYIDATISGSSQQIRDREATFMVGGNLAAFEDCRDLLEAVGDRIYHLGPSGAGAKAKLASNLILGLNRLVLAEGLVFAESLGLELGPFLELLKASPAYSAAMDVKGAKMLSGDFAPQSRIRQHHKDVAIILAYAQAAGVELPLSAAHMEVLEGALAAGDGDLDNAAVIREIRRRAGRMP